MRFKFLIVFSLMSLFFIHKSFGDCSIDSEDFEYSYKRFSQDGSKYFVLMKGRLSTLPQQNPGVYLAKNNEAFYLFKDAEYKKISYLNIFNAFVDNEGIVYEVPNHICKGNSNYNVRVFKKNSEVKEIPVKVDCNGKSIEFEKDGVFRIFRHDSDVKIENEKLSILTLCGNVIYVDLKKLKK
jgi:hypothetical protein